MRYLWIDAVYIIQEGAGEWEADAESMEEAFSSAYCTFAADSAADWKLGSSTESLSQLYDGSQIRSIDVFVQVQAGL